VVARLDIHFRVDPTSDRLDVVHSVSGAATITLTPGLYAGLAALCAELTTQLQTLDADLQAVETAGTVTLLDNHGDSFSVTWTRPALRDWLGYTGNLAASDRYTAPLQSPGTFIASQPWDSDRPLGWEWRLKRWTGAHQRGASLRIGRLDLWHTKIQCSRSELAQLRGVLSRMLRGQPARWWRDKTVSAAWSWAQWWGYLDVVLASGTLTYADRWADETVLSHLETEIEMLEYSG